MASAAFRRLSRDRTAVFFMLILPAVIILVVGTVAEQPESFRVGLVDEGAGQEGAELTRAMESSSALDIQRFDGVGSARTALRRGELETAVVLPAGMDAALAEGRTTEVVVLADQTNATHRAAAQAVSAVVVDRAARLAAAATHQAQTGGDPAASRAVVAALAATVARVEVRPEVVDSESGILPPGFQYSAPTMLTLFVFITCLTGGAAMIESRRLGIHARMLAAPVTARAIVVGESISYFAVALVQSAVIIVLGASVFGVSWGDPVAAAALVGLWALVGTGTGMLAGTLFRTPEQAASIGTTVGIAAGMLGGTMWPLEIVSPAMRAVGHLVPHAWAVDSWIELLSRDGGLADIARELAVLAGFAVALLAAASVRLRHRLTG